MKNSINHKLKAAADAAQNSKSVEESMKHLANAFALFSTESSNLEEAYIRLEERFKKVNEELEKANDTLRKKILQLNSVSSYLSNILKNISQGIIFIDSDGIITTYNNAAESILDFPHEALLFSHYLNHFSDDFFGFSIKESIKHKQTKQLNFIRHDHKEIEITATYVTGKMQHEGIILLLRDVTKMQKLQQVVARNERMKELGEMAAVVAHEIRNPLGGIRGYASLLTKDLQEAPHLQEMAQFIVEGTKTLERVVGNILHYSKPVVPKIQQYDMHKFLNEIVKLMMLDPTKPEKILIDFHCSPNPFKLPFDYDLMRSAIINLIINAFQAEGTKKITVSALQNNLHCILTISDDGEGISERDLENIFSPFFTTKQQGTGLGLSEVFKIIQAHNGQIDARSIRGRGTSFTISLPINNM
ncbi:MAG TPA: ATP-binding protein [Chlamydiales bacterium]|nr:ATP-binding protein [Chlamydiales bacterium]